MSAALLSSPSAQNRLHRPVINAHTAGLCDVFNASFSSATTLPTVKKEEQITSLVKRGRTLAQISNENQWINKMYE